MRARPPSSPAVRAASASQSPAGSSKPARVVVVTARNEDTLRSAAAQLGANALAICCDNADPADIARMAEEAWQISPSDIVVNNAGIAPYYKRVEHVTLEDWASVVDVNLRGTYFCSVENGKRMLAAERPGSVIQITSMLGITPGERTGVYGATKAGIQQFAKVMALEWAAHNVRVNCIAPGWTETDFTTDLMGSRHGSGLLADVPMGRMAEPDDIVDAALFLASDASTYVTGTVLVVDGGRGLR